MNNFEYVNEIPLSINVNSSLLKLRISKCPLRGRETYFQHNFRGKGHPYKYVVHSAYTYGLKFNPWTELCKAGLRKSGLVRDLNSDMKA